MLPGWARRRIFETVARHQFVHFGAEVFIEVFDVLRQPSVFLPLLPFFGFALAQVALFFGRGIPGCQATAGSRWRRTARGSGFRCGRSDRHQLKIMFVQLKYGAAFQLFANLGFYIGASKFRRFSGGF